MEAKDIVIGGWYKGPFQDAKSESPSINWNVDNAFQLTVNLLPLMRPAVLGRVQPISITEEWLIRFGFNRDDGVMCVQYIKDCQNYIFYYAVYETGVTFRIELDSNYYPEYIQLTDHVQYVHQFQNLYFALTGEELEIKQ